MEDAVWTAFVQSAGDPGDDYRLLGALPPSAMAAAVEGATLPNGEQLTVIQAAQLGLVYRLARRRIHVDAGLDLQLWVDPDPWKDQAGEVPTTPNVPKAVTMGVPERKMKYSAVLDQGDESEFTIPSETQKQAWLEGYINLTGGLPLEQEEPSLEQVAALQKRLAAGFGPYADFSVFLPYGRKAHRSQKYRTYIPTQEGYLVREIPGPSNFDQWRASYRVYRTALMMLNTLTMATCVAYEAHIEKLNRLYGGAWHLIVAADDLARSEHLVRLKVATNLDIANGMKEPPAWSDQSPWEALFRLLIKDNTFWGDQVHVLANAWLAHGSKGKPLTPSEAIAVNTIQGGVNAIQPPTEKPGDSGTSTSARRSRNERRKDAKKRKLESNQTENQKGGKGKGKGKDKPQACFAWNNQNGACAGLPPGAACRGRVPREHRCTKCGSLGHPSTQCTQQEGS